MPYDCLGIQLASINPTEIRRIAEAVRQWLDNRERDGYTFVCGVGNLHAALIVVHRQSVETGHLKGEQ